MKSNRNHLLADQRGAAAEAVLLLGALALAGAVAFITLADAMALAIGGGANGTAAVRTATPGGDQKLGAGPLAPMSVQAGLADVAKFLGRFDRSTVAPLEFVRLYAEDSSQALSRAVSPRALDYLNAEVLPILRATFVDEEGASLRYISPEDEGLIVTRIVAGDSRQARATVAAAKQRYVDSGFSGRGRAFPQDIDAVADIAAEMFKPYWVGKSASQADVWVPRTRFSVEEAEALIHLRAGAAEKLRARPVGGEVIADFVDSLLARDFERRAGMPEGADVQGLEAWLRGAALADTDSFNKAAELTGLIVRGVPELVTTEMGRLLQHFEAADAL